MSGETATAFEVRPGVYCDSVVLMQLQRSLAELDGVLDAGAVMATPANRALLQTAGFSLEDVTAEPDDLLIVIKAAGDDAARGALGQVDELLKRRRTQEAAGAFRPRSLASAAGYLPQAEWVLISVPGRYAADVAEEALALGKHVFLYSDNVTLEDEIRLKQQAREKGLLLMGPDCGTAIINGIGLGFANRVRRGSIGLVAASGTGLQAVSSGIHRLGGGISQAIGTGGRDLQAGVGGITALQAIDLLANDASTDVIVVLSKPIDAAVAPQIAAAARSSGKPVVLNLLGYPLPARQLGNLYFAATLHEAAVTAVALAEQPRSKVPVSAVTRPPKDAPSYLRGLFSGGTLAYELLLGLQTFLTPLYSNIPLRPEQKLADVTVSKGHTILDLGEDAFTQGRLHPMMDNDLRLRRLQQEAADPETGLIVLDVVLGEGSHPDPAAELAPAIAAIRAERNMDVMVLVVGTDADPQDMEKQIEMLAEAGADVVRDTLEAVTYISERLTIPYRYEFAPVRLRVGDGQLAAINAGLASFMESAQAQGAEVVQVDWRPPAGGNEDLMAILAKMKAG
ncbi:MAG: acyl-CoA synthetase FdrA [Candidatus Promineifilaceae bacterium]